MEKIERENLSLLFLLHRHVELMLQIVSCRPTVTASSMGSSSSDWVYVLESADQLNQVGSRKHNGLFSF